MNISISDALRERMQRFDDEANWSRLAADAFQDYVTYNEILKGEPDKMTKMIERLKASKKEYDAECKESGARDGREWAEERAEYAELVALEPLRERPVEWYGEIFELFDPEWQLNWDTRGGELTDETLESYFASGRKFASQPQYLNDWIDGALAAFDEVSSQL